MTTDERIERLERGNRRLRWAVIAGLGCLVAIGAGGQADDPDITARSVKIKDEAGVVRASLGMLDGEPSFGLADKTGKFRVVLYGMKDDFRLIFLDPDDNVAISAGIDRYLPSLRVKADGGQITARVMGDAPILEVENREGETTFKAPSAR